MFTALFELPLQCLRFVLVLSGLRISTTRKYSVKINGPVCKYEPLSRFVYLLTTRIVR